MFRLIASFCGMRYVGVPLAADFSLDERRMADAIEEHAPALMFIAYPNNPTGNLFDDRAIENVLKRAPGAVVIDEAYHAFAGRTLHESPGSVREPARHAHAVEERPGRACASASSPAARAGSAMSTKYAYPIMSACLLSSSRRRRSSATDFSPNRRRQSRRSAHACSVSCSRCAARHPIRARPNFILFRVAAADAVFGGLKERGVLIKNLHGSQPSLANCLRVTVGTPEENDRFLQALRETIDVSPVKAAASAPGILTRAVARHAQHARDADHACG